ncbi:alpha/beta hydrolase [Spirosoma knui]
MNRLFTILLPMLLVGPLPVLAQQGLPTAEQLRARMLKNNPVHEPLPDVFKTEVRTIWTGTDSIRIQIYYPSAEKNLPILYSIHGGAFILSALDGPAARVLCNRTKSIVVSVDYRVAPEHPFPTSINDCYAAWNWVVDHAQALGGNPQKISLIGDSAGGLFVGSLQVKRQQQGRPAKPLSLVFVNPGIDLRPTAAGLEEYGLVSSWYRNGADPTNPLVSPILNEHFTEYPPSLIITSEKDVLKPHGQQLADKLKAAGVPTQQLDLPDTDHLAWYWGSSHPKAQPAMEAVVSFLNDANAKMSK